ATSLLASFGTVEAAWAAWAAADDGEGRACSPTSRSCPARLESATLLLPLHHFRSPRCASIGTGARTTGRSGCPAGGVRRGRARACPAHHGQRDRGRRA